MQLHLRGDVLQEADAAHRIGVQQDGRGLHLLGHGQGVGEEQPRQPDLCRAGGFFSASPYPWVTSSRQTSSPAAGGHDQLAQRAVAQRAGDLGEEHDVLRRGPVSSLTMRNEQVHGIAVAGVVGDAPAAPARRRPRSLPTGQPRVGDGDSRSRPRSSRSSRAPGSRRTTASGQVPSRSGASERGQLADRPFLRAAAQGHDPLRVSGTSSRSGMAGFALYTDSSADRSRRTCPGVSHSAAPVLTFAIRAPTVAETFYGPIPRVRRRPRDPEARFWKRDLPRNVTGMLLFELVWGLGLPVRPVHLHAPRLSHRPGHEQVPAWALSCPSGPSSSRCSSSAGHFLPGAQADAHGDRPCT